MRAKLITTFIVLVLGSLTSGAQGQEIKAVTPPRFALPSDTGHYLGYHVGGGAVNAHKAEPRQADEGTWGWDYQGWLVPRRVALGWWHGRRYQGGGGAYKTDGPRLLQEK
jgi:hypothetical protein